MLVLTIISAAAILIANILLFSSHVDATMNDRVSAAAKVAENELERVKAQMSVASAYISQDQTILRAMENGDRNVLLSRAKQLQSETGASFCTIADARGMALARPHNPEMHGDDVTVMPTVKSALSGKSLTDIEPGSSVRMSVCAASPVYNDQNKLLGVVAVGYRLDTEEFVDSIKSLLGCEVTIFLGDERISTTVLKEDGTRAVGTKSTGAVSATVLAGNPYVGQVKILDRDALTRYNPIWGADGKALGMLFVGRYMNEKTDTVQNFLLAGLLIMLILLAVSIPVILFIVKRIVSPIHTMVEAAHALAVGDTEISVQSNANDEMGELEDAFNEMIKNTRKQTQTIEAIAAGDLAVTVETRSEKDLMNNALKNMLDLNNSVFARIVGSSKQVSSSTRQIADSSQSLAQGAAQQAASVEQLSGIVGTVAGQTKDNAVMAGESAALADTIKNNAQKGSEQMGRMVQAVQEINTANQSIDQIIKTIEDIAFQTNLLALNAAVEAARAGDHGKGFAVVADEVRKLAAKSAEAAKSTGSLIENSIAKAELGVRIAGETAASLHEVVSGINESGRLASEISSSSERQNTAISQINDGINQVAQVVQQNSVAAEELAATSEEMNGQADMLEELVSKFKLK